MAGEYEMMSLTTDLSRFAVCRTVGANDLEAVMQAGDWQLIAMVLAEESLTNNEWCAGPVNSTTCGHGHCHPHPYNTHSTVRRPLFVLGKQDAEQIKALREALKDRDKKIDSDATALEKLRHEVHVLTQRDEELSVERKSLADCIEDLKRQKKSLLESVRFHESEATNLRTELFEIKKKIGTVLYDQIKKLAEQTEEEAS